jgi:hypothetical protein
MKVRNLGFIGKGEFREPYEEVEEVTLTDGLGTCPLVAQHLHMIEHRFMSA